MSLIITTPLPLVTNECNIADSDDATLKKGLIKFHNPVFTDGVYKVTVWGKNVEGKDVEEVTIEIDAEYTINPSKVAKWILRKLAEHFNKNPVLP